MELNHRLLGDGPPLVLIPGMGLDFGVWDEVVDRLAGRFCCLLVDNRGAGSSAAPPGPYSVRQLAADIRELVLGSGIDRSMMAGHSLGGFVALQLALEHPDSIRHLVLISTAAHGDPRRLGASPEVLAALARTGGPLEEIVRGNVRVAVAEGYPERQPERFEAFVAARLDRAPQGRGVAGQRAAARAFDVRDRLWEVRCETVVVHGLADRMIPPARGRELARGIAGARLEELGGVGHLPMLEAPRDLARIIENTCLTAAGNGRTSDL